MNRTNFFLSNALDFYFLEALRIQPVRFGNKPQERLRRDVVNLHDQVSHDLARAFYDYLVITSTGEARHTRFKSSEGMVIREIDVREKVDAYRNALRFDPDQLLPYVHSVFSKNRWPTGGFGGRAWAQVVEAARMYGNVPDIVFIDHVIDIEHNNGNVFNKPEIKYAADFKLDIDTDHLLEFLTWKAHKDILDPGNVGGLGHLQTYVSKFVYRLMQRYWTIYLGESQHPRHYRHSQQRSFKKHKDLPAYPRYRPVSWGQDRVSTFWKHEELEKCDACGTGHIYPDEMHRSAEVGKNKTADLCPNCYDNRLKCDKCGCYTTLDNKKHSSKHSWVACDECRDTMPLSVCWSCSRAIPIESLNEVHSSGSIRLYCLHCTITRTERCQLCQRHVRTPYLRHASFQYEGSSDWRICPYCLGLLLDQRDTPHFIALPAEKNLGELRDAWDIINRAGGTYHFARLSNTLPHPNSGAKPGQKIAKAVRWGMKEKKKIDHWLAGRGDLRDRREKKGPDISAMPLAADTDESEADTKTFTPQDFVTALKKAKQTSIAGHMFAVHPEQVPDLYDTHTKMLLRTLWHMALVNCGKRIDVKEFLVWCLKNNQTWKVNIHHIEPIIAKSGLSIKRMGSLNPAGLLAEVAETLYADSGFAEWADFSAAGLQDVIDAYGQSAAEEVFKILACDTADLLTPKEAARLAAGPSTTPTPDEALNLGQRKEAENVR